MARQSTDDDTPARVPALDDIRPPETRIVQSYDRDGEYVTLDDPVPESEIPADADVASHIKSMSESNEADTWVIVHERFVTEDEADRFGQPIINHAESGIIRLLAPDYDQTVELFWETADAFDTWQAAEAFIAEHYEQPAADHERIRPRAAGWFSMWVQEYRQAAAFDAPELQPPRFHQNSPLDDAFWADATDP